MPTRRSFPTPSSIWWSMPATPCPAAARSPSAPPTRRVTSAARAGHRHHAGGRLCAHRSRRHRHRHVQGDHEQDLRSLLHHQAGGPGHRPGPRHRLWHRQADRRLHHRRQRSRPRHRASRSICRAIASTPMRRAASEAVAAAPRDVTGQDTILLVEDEEAVRSFAARALAHARLQCAGSERRRRSAGDRQAPARRKSICSSPMW